MNRPVSRTTQSAEGMPRRAFTVAELEQMVAAGILDEDERIELIGGEVVPMSPKGNHHEALKIALSMFWVPRVPADLVLAGETTLRFSDDTYVEPDFVVFPRAGGIKGLSANTAKLVVEIADSSLRYDLGRKADVCSAFGVAELWVIDAMARTTRIHRTPTPTGYRSMLDLPEKELLTPMLVPALAVTLADLDFR